VRDLRGSQSCVQEEWLRAEDSGILGRYIESTGKLWRLYGSHFLRDSWSLKINTLRILNYKYKPYIVKHNSINDFIKVYLLNYLFQRHVSALVMSHLQVVYFS